MGLKILTVLYQNSDSSKAGAVLLNSNRVSNAKLHDTNDTVFNYESIKNQDVVLDKYWVDETLTTFDDIYNAVNKTFYTLPVHDDVDDSSSATTNRPIDVDDIVRGVAYSSSKSLLHVQDGGKIVKILVNKSLYAIEDYVMTGTTTTSTTTAA